MPDKIRLGICACLLGKRTRYDGKHKLDRNIMAHFGKLVKWAAVCPETGCGLPVPREPMRLVGKGDKIRLMTRSTGIDHTVKIRSWSRKEIHALKGMAIRGFIFKSGSPSCGLKSVPIYGDDGLKRYSGSGIFAGAFKAEFTDMPVIDEKDLCRAALRKKFVIRVFGGSPSSQCGKCAEKNRT